MSENDTDARGDEHTTVVLVSCSKSKRDGTHRAEDLYAPSDIFNKRVAFSNQEGDHWGVLSGKHAYLRPWDVVDSYDMHRKERSNIWAAFVLRDLLTDLEYWDADEVITLAAKDYVEPLVPELEARGYDVIDYNNGLRPGERKAALLDALQPGEQGTFADVEADA